MANPYVGEIRIFGGNFAPSGWAFCNGAIQAIAQNNTLFTLIGTTYGGDGQSTFALPDLQGRVPVGLGQGTGLTNRIIGEKSGVENVTLTVPQIPAHTHVPLCSTDAGDSISPAGTYWAANANTSLPQFAAAPNATSMNAAGVANAGGSQPHNNLMPLLTISFIISLFGIFPSQN